MKGRTAFGLIIAGILAVVDFYAFTGISRLVESTTPSEAAFVGFSWSYLGLSVMMLGGFLFLLNLFAKISSQENAYKIFTNWFAFMLAVYVPKLIFSVFLLLEDVAFGVTHLINEETSRFLWLSWVGAGISILLFLAVLHGVVRGRFAFMVREEHLAFPNLPKAFDGLKIVQLSDAHLGSFFERKGPVQRAIDLLNGLKPDLVLFTGDLVNNRAIEAEPWIEEFSGIEARLGKYSILGNHDYGDYSSWNSPEEKVQNLQRLHQIHDEMGFKLLLNEHEQLEERGEKIAIAGVENWGLPPFPQYGDLDQALKGSEEVPFKVLLSHDPSHWDAEVRNREDVDLTLSGHTHGMQFGIEWGKLRWSPVKQKYPRWAGLFQEAKQYLYVNRGFGYIGFPGRVGIWPEITLLTLKSS